MLAEFQRKFSVKDLPNLPNHNIYLKLMIDGCPQSFKHMNRGNLCDWAFPDLRENVQFKPVENVLYVKGRPTLNVSFMPLAGDTLESVGGGSPRHAMTLSSFICPDPIPLKGTIGGLVDILRRDPSTFEVYAEGRNALPMQKTASRLSSGSSTTRLLSRQHG